MGITGAHELSHSVKGLSIQEVYSVCMYIRLQQRITTQPTIDLDASLIYRSSKLSVDNRMRQIIDICCQLSSVGFLVVVVCDGAVRHHTKRASVQRQAILFSQKVKSYLLQLKLMSILDERKGITDEALKLQLEGEETIISSDLKALERKIQYSSVDVGQQFYESLLKHVNNIPAADLGKKSGNVSVIQAEYQADSVLAYRRVNKFSDVVFSSDSDLLAHSGELCLGIKSFNSILRGKKAGFDNIELFTADEKMLGNIISALHKSPDSSDIKLSRNGIFRVWCRLRPGIYSQ